MIPERATDAGETVVPVDEPVRPRPGQSELVAMFTEVLDEHRPFYVSPPAFVDCTCGWEVTREGGTDVTQHRVHQAEQLAARLGIERQSYGHCAYHGTGDYCYPYPPSINTETTEIKRIPVFRIAAFEANDA